MNKLLVDKLFCPSPIERLVTQQALRYVEKLGDWIRFPDTIHEMFSHLPQTLGMVYVNR